MSADLTPRRSALLGEVRDILRAIEGKTPEQVAADMVALAPLLYSVDQVARRRTVRALRSVAAELADEARDHQKIRGRALLLGAHHVNQRADAIERREVRS